MTFHDEELCLSMGNRLKEKGFCVLLYADSFIMERRESPTNLTKLTDLTDRKRKDLMNYAEIKEYDIANGPGVRVSLFVSGCRNKCPGCFNPETWDFQYGQTYTLETEDRILRSLMPDYIEGLTLLGGEPFEPENQAVLVGLLRKVKGIYPKKSIWCYTGYTYERDLLRGGDQHTSFTDEMLSLIDVLVDGRFLLAEKDITLLYRGSRNQRILALHEAEEKTAEDGAVPGEGRSGRGTPAAARRQIRVRDALEEIGEIARGDSRWK